MFVLSSKPEGSLVCFLSIMSNAFGVLFCIILNLNNCDTIDIIIIFRHLNSNTII